MNDSNCWLITKIEKYDGNGDLYMKEVIWCKNCNNTVPPAYVNEWNYCPYCGVKILNKQEIYPK